MLLVLRCEVAVLRRATLLCNSVTRWVGYRGCRSSRGMGLLRSLVRCSRLQNGVCGVDAAAATGGGPGVDGEDGSGGVFEGVLALRMRDQLSGAGQPGEFSHQCERMDARQCGPEKHTRGTHQR